MSVSLHTGHAEIDRQHDSLSQQVNELNSVCEMQRQNGKPCLQCPKEHHLICKDRLAELISKLLGFMLDHFAYEERLMRLLPETDECRDHIEQHQYAHAEISRLLSDLTAKLDRGNPAQSALHLRNIIVAWLGRHGEKLDRPLAITLEGAYDAEIDLDRELSCLLGE